MQDLKTKELLNILLTQDNPYGYKIFSFEELSSAMPEYLGADVDTVKECIDLLNREGYISVKYRDLEQICLCLIHSERKESDVNRPIKKGFSSAFLGGVTGGLIGALITLACSIVGGGKC